MISENNRYNVSRLFQRALVYAFQTKNKATYIERKSHPGLLGSLELGQTIRKHIDALLYTRVLQHDPLLSVQISNLYRHLFIIRSIGILRYLKISLDHGICVDVLPHKFHKN